MILTAGEDSRVSAWAVPRGGVIPSGTYGSNISSQRNDVIENDEMDVDSPRKGSSISVGSKRERDAEERVAVSKRVKSVSHLPACPKWRSNGLMYLYGHSSGLVAYRTIICDPGDLVAQPNL